MNHDDTNRDAMRIERLEGRRRSEVISAYLDDELAPSAARHVTTWLDAHPEELREVEHLRRLWDVLDLYDDEPVSADFSARVLARTGRAAPRARWSLPLRPRLAAAAAAVLVLGVGGLLLSSQRSEEPSAPNQELADLSSLDSVPAEYLEQADALIALSDDEFQALLLADLEDPWGS